MIGTTEEPQKPSRNPIAVALRDPFSAGWMVWAFAFNFGLVMAAPFLAGNAAILRGQPAAAHILTLEASHLLKPVYPLLNLLFLCAIVIAVGDRILRESSVNFVLTMRHLKFAALAALGWGAVFFGIQLGMDGFAELALSNSTRETLGVVFPFLLILIFAFLEVLFFMVMILLIYLSLREGRFCLSQDCRPVLASKSKSLIVLTFIFLVVSYPVEALPFLGMYFPLALEFGGAGSLAFIALFLALFAYINIFFVMAVIRRAEEVPPRQQSLAE